MTEQEQLDKYYKLTGHDFRYLMQGGMQYGPDFIFKELVPQALEENKKIVWKERLVDGQDLGLLDYELQPL